LKGPPQAHRQIVSMGECVLPHSVQVRDMFLFVMPVSKKRLFQLLSFKKLEQQFES